MNYQLINTQTELVKLLSPYENFAGDIVLDTEGTGLTLQDKIRLIQLKLPDVDTFIIDCRDVKNLDYLKQWMVGKKFIIQNAKFDMKLLYANFGIDLRDNFIFCTQLAENVLNSHESASLKELIKKYCGTDGKGDLQEIFLADNPKYKGAKEDIYKHIFGYDVEITNNKYYEYASADCNYLHEIKRKQIAALKTEGLIPVYKLELKTIRVLLEAELAGITFDIDNYSTIVNYQQAEIDSRLKLIGEDYFNSLTDSKGKPIKNFNLNSAIQVGKVIKALDVGVYTQLPKTDKTNQISTKAENLEPFLIDNEKIKLLYECLLFRDSIKSLTQYRSAVTEDGKIRSSVNQVLETGRMAATKPNTMNVPKKKEVRSLFKADQDTIYIHADFSQIELRLCATVANEKVMIAEYKKGEEADLHTLSGRLLFGKENLSKSERQAAKPFNFGIIYGAQAKRLRSSAAEYGVELTEEESQDLMNKFLASYPEIKNWQSSCRLDALQGEPSYTLLGRKRVFVKPDNFKQLEWWRQRMWESNAINAFGNHQFQGSGADLLKMTLIILRKYLPKGATVIHFVHDEIIIETPKRLAEIVRLLLYFAMDKAGGCFLHEIPCMTNYKEVEMKANWGDDPYIYLEDFIKSKVKEYSEDYLQIALGYYLTNEFKDFLSITVEDGLTFYYVKDTKASYESLKEIMAVRGIEI